MYLFINAKLLSKIFIKYLRYALEYIYTGKVEDLETAGYKEPQFTLPQVMELAELGFMMNFQKLMVSTFYTSII